MTDVFFDYQLRTPDDLPGGIISPREVLNTPLEVDDGGAGDAGSACSIRVRPSKRRNMVTSFWVSSGH